MARRLLLVTMTRPCGPDAVADAVTRLTGDARPDVVLLQVPRDLPYTDASLRGLSGGGAAFAAGHRDRARDEASRAMHAVADALVGRAYRVRGTVRPGNAVDAAVAVVRECGADVIAVAGDYPLAAFVARRTGVETVCLRVAGFAEAWVAPEVKGGRPLTPSSYFASTPLVDARGRPLLGPGAS